MNMLKHTTLLPLATLALMSFNAQSGDVDRTLSWESGGEINVNITAGQIEFRGWNKQEVKLTGDFSGDDERLTFKKSGRNIKLELEDESNSWWGKRSGGNADFTIFAPFSSDLDIDGTSLTIEADDINGSVDINSISGSVRLKGPSKRVDVETVSGDIRIEEASGKMRLRTVSGDIEASVKAESFDAKTVSGDIEGNISELEFASFLSVSGDIDVELNLIADGRIEGQTVSGNLRLNFKDGVNSDFKLNTGPGGDIDNRITKDKPADNNHWGQELRFTTGDGEGTVDLETMSGSIRIR